MTNKYRYEQLYTKFLNGECTEQELRELLQQFESEQVDPLMMEAVYKALESSESTDEQLQKRAQSVVSGADGFIQENILRQSPTVRSWWKPLWTATAVAAMLICVFGFYRWFQVGSTAIDTAFVTESVPPGKTQAVISLSDGRSFHLEENGGGIVVDDQGIRYNNGERIVGSAQVPSATIETPRGGEYKVALPDGTIVWLNADSRLSYPTVFNGQKRIVSLQGEAYFDVSHDAKHPFVVIHDDMEVTVLGTEFNIKGYRGESLQTTLVQGSVDVKLKNRDEAVRLHPGNQLSVTNEQVRVVDVNTDAFTRWKDGVFYFNDLRLEDVLKQIERWYDVTVAVKQIPNLTVYGEIDRNTSLREVLDLLELATSLQFELNERRIMILENN